MTLVEELRSKKSRDNRDLLDRAADRIEELEKHLPSTLTNEEKVSEKVKQIEEMVMELAEAHHEMDVAWTNYFSDSEKFPKPKTEHLILAEHLYNAGYRKQSEAEWIENEDDFWVMCSECGTEFLDDQIGIVNTYSYCPNCGSKMKGGE